MNHLVRQYYEQGTHVASGTREPLSGLGSGMIRRKTGGADGVFFHPHGGKPIRSTCLYTDDYDPDVENKHSIKTPCCRRPWKSEDH